jgi:SAM-dependent methyltransferase
MQADSEEATEDGTDNGTGDAAPMHLATSARGSEPCRDPMRRFSGANERRETPRMSHYVYDTEFAEERTRLEAMETLWDPGTRRVLTDVGIAPGWSCLEVGAGGGSVPRGLIEGVGPTGRVVAADLDPRYLEDLPAGVEVVQLDVRTDELPDGDFDLIHARLLLEHLSEHASVVQRLATKLRPGGWLVVEDYDWGGFGFRATAADLDRIAEAVLDFMSLAGFHPRYGRMIPDDFDAAGLRTVHCEGRALVLDQPAPGFAFFRLSFESLRPALVQGGHVTAADAEIASQALNEPTTRLLTPLMVAGCGQRPA